MNGKILNNNGQVLLLLVLVMGTLLIVAMTAIFQSTSSTQIGGVEQQSQVTLAAAEAAIEKALQSGESGTFADLGLTNLSGISLENSQVTINEEREYVFLTSKLEKDEQYTFYMAEYQGTYPDYFGPSYTKVPFYIYYQSDNPDCSDISLEMTVIYDQTNDAITGGSYEMKKYLVDNGNLITEDNDDDIGQESGSYPGVLVGVSENLEGTTFQCRTGLFDTEVENLLNAKVILVQTYFKASTLAFAVEGFDDPTPEYQFPPQGRTVTATARAKVVAPTITVAGLSATPTPFTAPSETGLTRTAQVFQSYPQIPTEFWITSF